MSPTSNGSTRVFRVPSAAGSSLILEHAGRNFDLSQGLDRARHGDLLQLVERGFFDSFPLLEQTAVARRWPAPPPSELLTPLEPRQIGKVLALHVAPRELFEQQTPGAERHCFSNRSPASLAASGAVIHVPELVEPATEKPTVLRHETFLAVVLSRRARAVSLEQASASIAGYMVASDFTQRALGSTLNTNWFGKSPLGTLVIGPAFVPANSFDLEQVQVGSRRQRGGATEPMRSSLTSSMASDVPLAIAAMSRLAILHAGDIVLVPTGNGLGPVDSGDDVRCWIEGIGELANNVQKRALLRRQA